MTDLHGQIPVSGNQLSAALVQSANEAQATTMADRRRRRRRRVALLTALALVIAFTARTGHERFFADPEPLPLPSSTTRSVTTNDRAWPSGGGALGQTRAVRGPESYEGIVLWSNALGAAPSAGISSDGTNLYVPLVDGRLVALSEETGRELWAVSLPSAINFTPVIAEDRLYATLPGGRILAINVTDGEVLWEIEHQHSLSAPPLVFAGTLYAFADGSIVGFDAQVGRELWRRSVDSHVALTNPAIEGDTLVASTTDRILVFDRLTGEELYWYKLPPVIEGLAIANGVVFASASTTIVAIGAEARRPWWEPARGIWFQFWIWGMAPQTPVPPSEWVARGRHDSAPAVADGKIAVASRDGTVTMRSTIDGAILWTRNLENAIDAPVLTSSGLLVALPSAILLLDSESGATLWEQPISEEPVAFTVTGLAVYTVSRAGTIRAYH